MIRLLLVDDHGSLRESMAYLLNLQPDLTVVGQAGSLAEARSVLSGVDLVLLDLDLPDGNGATLIHELHAVNPDANVLVLTGSSNHTDHAHAIEQGAGAVLNKTVPIAIILDAIRRLAAGEPVHTQTEIIGFLQHVGHERAREERVRSRFAALTPREREVLNYLSKGKSEKDIAQELNISTRTAHNHLVSILSKLDVESRLQAVLVSLQAGVVTLNPDEHV